MDSLVLATTSSHRIEAFRLLGIKFDSVASDVEGYDIERPSEPVELVKFLSKLKAEAVASEKSQNFVLGFDTIGVY